MKTNKLIFLFSILMSMLTTNASAYSFALKNADGVMIYYEYYDTYFEQKNTQVLVTYKTNAGNDYSGSVVIPKEVTYNNKTLKVTYIHNKAFQNCKNLKSVTIPNSVTGIGWGAFDCCSNLTSVTIPNSVTGIQDCAFRDCSSLTSITIPNSVTSIGEAAFLRCENLKSVKMPNKLTSIEDKVFFSCDNLTSITIPNSVTSIGKYAFGSCSGLTSITIPNSVTSIGDKAFSGCDGITTLTIPNSVTSIGKYAFGSCSGLTSITIPNSVKSIGDEAFEYCEKLTSITIPQSVTSIGEKILANCSRITSIIVDKKNSKYDSRNDCNAIIETKSNKLIMGCKNTVIPNNVTSIANGAFYFMGTYKSDNFTIPNSVTSIGDQAFYWFGITYITIGNSVKSIGKQAFETNPLRKITSKITNPLAIAEDAFSNFIGATLYVPKGTVAKYRATQGWKNFKRILEEGTTTGIADVEADNTLNTSNSIYDINGKRLPATSIDELPSGLYIVNGKKVVK